MNNKYYSLIQFSLKLLKCSYSGHLASFYKGMSFLFLLFPIFVFKSKKVKYYSAKSSSEKIEYEWVSKHKEEHEGYQIINIPNGIIKLNLIMNLKS